VHEREPKITQKVSEREREIELNIFKIYEILPLPFTNLPFTNYPSNYHLPFGHTKKIPHTKKKVGERERVRFLKFYQTNYHLTNPIQKKYTPYKKNTIYQFPITTIQKKYPMQKKFS